jgi:hypothetical protein
MSQFRRICVLASAAVAGLAFNGVLRATIVASDSANDPAYTVNAAFNGLNGGTGFGAWVVTDSPSGDADGGDFINSTTNDNAAGRFPAPLFDIFDNGTPNSSSATGAVLGSSIETATRSFNTPFTGSGSSFSFIESLASLRAENSGTQTSQVGFELLDSSGNVLLNLYTFGGATGYWVVDASNSGNPYELLSTDPTRSPERALTVNSAGADSINIALTDNSGDYTITSGGHEASTFADGGQINMSTGGPVAFAYYDNNGGDGSDVRLNNLVENVAAVPEPVSGALVGLGLLLAIGQRRRR